MEDNDLLGSQQTKDGKIVTVSKMTNEFYTVTHKTSTSELTKEELIELLVSPGEFILTAKDNIKGGDLVRVNLTDLSATPLPKEIVGGPAVIAKRDFNKGKMLVFDDQKNTNDLSLISRE